MGSCVIHYSSQEPEGIVFATKVCKSLCKTLNSLVEKHIKDYENIQTNPKPCKSQLNQR